MSHRTIIEINHDYLHEYKDNPSLWDNVLMKLWSNDWNNRHLTRDTPGIRKIGERHHSTQLVLEIGGYRSDVS